MSLEKPPELARILSSHLTAPHCACTSGSSSPYWSKISLFATSCCAIVLSGLNTDSLCASALMHMLSNQALFLRECTPLPLQTCGMVLCTAEVTNFNQSTGPNFVSHTRAWRIYYTVTFHTFSSMHLLAYHVTSEKQKISGPVAFVAQSQALLTRLTHRFYACCACTCTCGAYHLRTLVTDGGNSTLPDQLYDSSSIADCRQLSGRACNLHLWRQARR